MKVRTLRGVVSPAHPLYLYGLVDDESGAEMAAGMGDEGAGGGGGLLAARPVVGESSFGCVWVVLVEAAI
jgi:hypothetical protein